MHDVDGSRISIKKIGAWNDGQPVSNQNYLDDYRGAASGVGRCRRREGWWTSYNYRCKRYGGDQLLDKDGKTSSLKGWATSFQL